MIQIDARVRDGFCTAVANHHVIGVLSMVFYDGFLGVVLAAVAGIMVFIFLDELLPAAREYGHPHMAIYGVFAGMAVMAVSLVLFL